MIFKIIDKEYSNFKEWDNTHKKVCELYNNKTQPAIGGRLTFSFTPTSLGTAVSVECACGKKKNITEYNW